MRSGQFTWQGQTISFRPGETIAAALAGAGIGDLGRDGAGAGLRYFCGIGACQSCLVRADGRIVEACLTPARDGAVIAALEPLA
ncbi:2Fe-2S iron-sulfur cluster-binding protein [Nitratireductor soli]|uniref:2Fe-2S iron-sulfur cluster-binding protein n=1 Tax=Nitratireductor soli TaxID=1670619 RepID=UPI00065E4D4A|nr:2Fe-2S iron-sulfur cluster-binding protein [Nitratireductor soli]